MDSGLKDRLKKIRDQIDQLHNAEEIYLTLESAKEHKLSRLQVSAPDILSSEAAKKSWAQGTSEWAEFRKGLATAEADFHKEKHLLDLMNSAFQAEYLAAKVEYDLVKKT